MSLSVSRSSFLSLERVEGVKSEKQGVRVRGKGGGGWLYIGGWVHAFGEVVGGRVMLFFFNK